ncbi:hypothetical protein BCR32DRAFT_280275 [Anaeromyces robustus]|uniref:Uncharacterized protein n=1 Tax=Anaeromyces robustus TaxID=1754192 RepID=A0A1Y1X5Y1_9FUNG|nr:hypothetical protein BCR32DRAFT_280275 [Anaeromyces robustus]|eukprot:ORX80776.1 hypothetical protein BCR32DRAFT_280275 [Anaeromyces robustus]
MFIIGTVLGGIIYSINLNLCLNLLSDNLNIPVNYMFQNIESRLQRRGYRCNCGYMAIGNCPCECGDKIEAVTEGEKKCFKEALSINFDSLDSNKVKEKRCFLNEKTS